MDKKQAKAEGFTHYGSYYGLPVYIGSIESVAPEMMCKYESLDFMIEVISHIEGFVRSIAYPDDEPVFQIRIDGEL